MDPRNLIVFLDNSRTTAARIDVAVDLALRNDAHLTAVHVAYTTLYPYPPEAGVALLLEKLDEERRASCARVEQRFVAAAQRAGIGYDWHALEAADLDQAAVLARVHDLALTGQRDPDEPDHMFSGGFLESIVLGAGRPMLLLPYAVQSPSAFSRVLVAWNGSREAARAVADSLTFLRRAETVAVMTVESAAEQPPQSLPELDIAAWLSRHGVKAELMPSSGVEIGVGEYLLSRAADMDANLIVAGAYGHTRVREFVLGGVTRTLFRSAPVPVLMSH